MLDFLKKMMGTTPGADIAELLSNGAIIVDVRTKGEYQSGHVKGSVNIPLGNLQQQLNRFKSKDQVIVTCCLSGSRSGVAKDILKNAGYVNVHNGGSWQVVRQKVK